MPRLPAVLGLVACASAKPIAVDIYYEADCPFSKNFVANDMGAAMNSPDCVQQYTDFDWIPYGNADVATSGNPAGCQHGEDECFGNRLQLCAKKKYGIGEQLDKFIVCVMTNLMVPGKMSHDRDTWEGCDAASADELEQCATGDESLEMLKQAGQRTADAHPEQAPFAVFKDLPTYMIQGNPGEFVNNICMKIEEMNLGAKPACCAEAVDTMNQFQAQLISGRRLLV